MYPLRSRNILKKLNLYDKYKEEFYYAAAKPAIRFYKNIDIRYKKSFETLDKSLNLPENLLDYIDKKDIPLKTVAVIISQHKNIPK